MVAKDKSLQEYYTESDALTSFMVDQLDLKEYQLVLEPCAGRGAFIDAILAKNPATRIDAIEISQASYQALQHKYAQNPNVSVSQRDFLFDPEVNLWRNLGGRYDCVVANPPYGAQIEKAKRQILKALHNNEYVKETYGLFLRTCIDLTKNQGKLVFILPDTYQTLHLHKGLRKYILQKCQILKILNFPSNFFPNVSYGYANMSIIVLQRSDNAMQIANNTTLFYGNFQTIRGFNKLPEHEISRVAQNLIASEPNLSFSPSINAPGRQSRRNVVTLGEIAACVTGFYSGDDKRFLRVAPYCTHRNAKYYQIAESRIIETDASKYINNLEGLTGQKRLIPIIKGNKARYTYQPEWYVDWSTQAISHYKKDKKARFQNSSYYFRPGVAVPMVRSTNLNAFYMQSAVFDQSIVGIFPNDPEMIWHILYFLNTEEADIELKKINSSTNNSANYIKKLEIPLTYDLKTAKKISEIRSKIFAGNENITLIDNLAAR